MGALMDCPLQIISRIRRHVPWEKKEVTVSLRQLGAFVLVMFLLALVAFGPVRHNGFINLDDDIYITGNEATQDGLTLESARLAFTSTRSDTWHPLTWLSHALDVQLFGLDPAGHHLMSLFLHFVASLLLMLVLARMTGQIVPAAFVALLFCLHPLRVESVAWAAERKDVLSAVFFMLTLWAHHRYARRSSPVRYAVVFLSFILGVLAKPMLVTLPFVLMLVDYWPLKRLSRRTVLEKIPLLVAAAVLSWVAYAVQAAGGATTLVEDLPAGARIGHAFWAYLGYLRQIFIPVNLVVLAPHPGAEIAFWKPLVAIIFGGGLGTLFAIRFRTRRYLLAGWLWYLGMLVPVAGFVAVGYHGLADRFTYLPSIGVAIVVVFGLAEVVSGRRKLALAASALGIVAVLGLTFMTRAQVRQWRNTTTLYTHTLARTGHNPVIRFNLGCAYRDAGDLVQAAQQFAQIVAGDPVHAVALIELGNLNMQDGRYAPAVQYWRQALVVEPNNYTARINIGWGLAGLGRIGEAIDEYLKLVESHPNDLNVLTRLSLFLLEDTSRRDTVAARRYAEQACRLTGYADPPTLFALAQTLVAGQDRTRALEVAGRAGELAAATGDQKLSQAIDSWMAQVSR